jgi:hypothetical protein
MRKFNKVFIFDDGEGETYTQHKNFEHAKNKEELKNPV